MEATSSKMQTLEKINNNLKTLIISMLGFFSIVIGENFSVEILDLFRRISIKFSSILGIDEEAINEAINEPSKEPINSKKPINEAINEPSKEPINEAINEPSKEPINEVINEPSKELEVTDIPCECLKIEELQLSEEEVTKILESLYLKLFPKSQKNEITITIFKNAPLDHRHCRKIHYFKLLSYMLKFGESKIEIPVAYEDESSEN